MKKCLFVNFNCAFNTHYETELDLMNQHQRKGDKVYSLHCNGNLNQYCAVAYKSDDKMICNYCQAKYHKGIELIKLAPENSFPIRNTDQYPDFVNNKFQSLNELAKIIYKDIDIGDNIVRTYKSIECIQADTVAKMPDKYIQNSLINSINVLNKFTELHESIGFDSVYFFSGRFPEYHPILKYCQNNDIAFYVHDRGANFSRYSCLKNSYFNNFSTMLNNWIRKPAEKYQESDETLEIGKKWYNSRIAGDANAWISFSKEQIKNSLPKNFNSDNFNIAIFNNSLHEVVIDDTRLPIKCFRDEMVIINKLCEKFKDRPEYKFHLRCHPNIGLNKGEQYDSLKLLKKNHPDNLTVTLPEEDIDTYGLIRSSDMVIIPMASTVGAEATYLEKPVILLGKSLYQELDVAYKPENFDQLFKLLANKELKSKPKNNAVQYGYLMATYGERFEYYEPTGLFEGTFMGVDLNKAHKFLPLKGKIKRFYYKQKASLLKRLKKNN